MKVVGQALHFWERYSSRCMPVGTRMPMTTKAMVRFCPTFSTLVHLGRGSDYSSAGNKKRGGRSLFSISIE
jgi:hypothetical protein